MSGGISLGGIVYLLLSLYTFALIARIVLEYLRMFARSWQPRGIILLLAELVFTITDPPGTGLTFSAAEIQVSKQGAASANSGGVDAEVAAAKAQAGVERQAGARAVRRRLGGGVVGKAPEGRAGDPCDPPLLGRSGKAGGARGGHGGELKALCHPVRRDAQDTAWPGPARTFAKLLAKTNPALMKFVVFNDVHGAAMPQKQDGLA